MNQQEHMDWAKQRALEHCDAGNSVEAFNSLISDLREHELTATHPSIPLMEHMAVSGGIKYVTPGIVRQFIEGL